MEPHFILRGNGRRLAVAWLISAAGSPVVAMAPQETGPTATASVEISVSVAKRYGLAVGDTDSALSRAGGRQYCIASNGNDMHLPVMLIFVPEGHGNETAMPTARAVQLAQCGASGKPLAAAAAYDKAIQEVIVRPE